MIRYLLSEPGESYTFEVGFIDEDGQTSTTTVVAELMAQKAPLLLGVKVDNRPVLLRSRDVVFNAGSPLHTEQPGIVAAVGQRFRCFGGGSVCDASNPISHWTKDEPLTFAMGESMRGSTVEKIQEAA